MQKVNHEKQIARLIDLVGRLEGVESERVRSAKSFLEHLPKNYETPRVAPDGEGGVVFAWEANKTTTFISIDLWLTISATKKDDPSFFYLDEASYDGGEIPGEILEHLPKKRA